MTRDWLTWNQEVLADEVAAMRARLEGQANGEPAAAATVDHVANGDAPAAIDLIAAMFGLSAFERAIVVLCAGVELDGSFAAACANAHGDATKTYPTFGLALAALPGAHWSAIAPSGALRLTPLIEVGASLSLTTAPLRIEERILHYLVGLNEFDERLIPYVEPLDERALVPSHDAAADRLIALWSPEQGSRPVAQLIGRDARAKRAITARAAARIGASAVAMRASALPRDARELETIKVLWEREARLSRVVLMLDCEDEGAEYESWARALVDRLRAPVVVGVAVRGRPTRRRAATIEVAKPTASEQRSLWNEAVTSIGAHADTERLAGQFDVSNDVIETACATAQPVARPGEDATHALWESCLRTVSPQLDDLAQRIAPRASWDDLVVPPAQRHLLEEIGRRTRNRWRVYEEWGFGQRDGRGCAITALFVGGSGTGKTLAAEILAGELGVDCYRVDLSQVVSKYIGETEKNLRRVFDAAEDGGAVLLFDEADALFGKRSEVRDSHDRYANIEVSFLLQRMETYRGLAILTTNMKDALDHAFVRRLGFIVHFQFPDQHMRAEIWRHIFPPQTPVDGLDVETLARMNVSGGTIRNIAVAAAFRAAEERAPVAMNHVIEAARLEFGKLERTFAEIDTESVL